MIIQTPDANDALPLSKAEFAVKQDYRTCLSGGERNPDQWLPEITEHAIRDINSFAYFNSRAATPSDSLAET